MREHQLPLVVSTWLQQTTFDGGCGGCRRLRLQGRRYGAAYLRQLVYKHQRHILPEYGAETYFQPPAENCLRIIPIMVESRASPKRSPYRDILKSPHGSLALRAQLHVWGLPCCESPTRQCLPYLSADTALRSRRTSVSDFSAAIALCAHAISSPQPSAVTSRLGEVQHGKPHPSQWSAERDVDRVGLWDVQY